MSRLTIKDVAKMVGVSPSAVSLAINGRPGISEATRKMILECVEQTGFVPSQNSRSLVMKRTRNIALLWGTGCQPLEHLFFSDITRCLLNCCMKANYSLVFVSCDFKHSPPVLPEIIRSHGVDGVVCFGMVPGSIAYAINQAELPLLILDSHTAVDNAYCVCVDYFQAARLAIEHLISLGHTDIAYIGGTLAQPGFSHQTFEGYRSTMQDHGLEAPFSWIQTCASELDDESAEEQMKLILGSGRIPTAVFCAADVYAIGAIRGIRKAGLSVPNDISVTGIDNIVFSRYLDPPLTTVSIDDDLLAEVGCELLFDAIEKGEHGGTILDYNNLTLVSRASCKSLKPSGRHN